MGAIAPRQPTALRRGFALGLLAIALSFTPTLHQAALVNLGGWPQFSRFLQASLHPDLTPALLATAGQALVTTLTYAICGTVLSLILGCGLGLLCSDVGWATLFPAAVAKLSLRRPRGALVRGLLALPRAIHELIWGLILVNIWGTDSLTGIVAIALPFGLITAKVFSEILDDTPRQAWTGLLTSGAAPWAAFCYGLLPQAQLNLLSYSFYRFECSLRSAAVLGMIGVGGLGTEIYVSLQSLRYEQLWTFFYALVLLNGLVDFGSARARRHLGCATRLDLNTGPAPSPISSLAPGPSVPAPSPAPSPRGGTMAAAPAAALRLLAWLAPPLLGGLCFWYLAPDLARAPPPLPWAFSQSCSPKQYRRIGACCPNCRGSPSRPWPCRSWRSPWPSASVRCWPFLRPAPWCCPVACSIPAAIAPGPVSRLVSQRVSRLVSRAGSFC